jgi:tetratricopeptide (TPR) repeat protein
MTASKSSSPRFHLSRPLVLLLGLVVVIALLSLPWQLRQWRNLQRERAVTRLQENRIAELRRSQEQERAALRAAASSELESRLQAADTLARAGNIAEAAAILRDLEPQAAGNASLLERLAGIYQEMNAVDRAYALTREALRLEPENPAALLRLGYLELFLGYPGPVLERFQKVAEKVPDQHGPYVAIALFHDHNRRLPEAERALRKARERAPGNPQALHLLAQNLVEQHRFEEAETLLAEAEKAAPNDPQSLLLCAFLEQERARMTPARAVPHLERAKGYVERYLLIDPRHAGALFSLGQILRDLGDNAGARRAWEQTYALAPRHKGLHIPYGQLLIRLGERDRGQALMAEGRRLDMEEDEFNKLVNQLASAPDNLEARRRLARWCGQHNRLSRALLEWNRVLERLPQDAEALRMREELRRKRGY